MTEAIATSGHHVLVIEDDEDFREIVCDGLRDWGAHAWAAENRDAALALIASGKRPSVIVMDLMMPGMDPDTFLHRLSEEGFEDTPLIIMSAAVATRYEPRPSRSFVRLNKPFAFDLLLEQIERSSD